MITDNLGYDVNRAGTNLFIIQLAFLSVAWTISFFRAYVKLCMIRKVTADDYWMLASLVRLKLTSPITYAFSHNRDSWFTRVMGLSSFTAS